MHFYWVTVYFHCRYLCNDIKTFMYKEIICLQYKLPTWSQKNDDNHFPKLLKTLMVWDYILVANLKKKGFLQSGFEITPKWMKGTFKFEVSVQRHAWVKVRTL